MARNRKRLGGLECRRWGQLTQPCAVLVLMLSGVALRAIAQPLSGDSGFFGGLTVLSAALELAAVLTFMAELIRGRVMADSV